MTSSHTPRLPVQAPEGIKSPVAVATIEEIDLEGLQVINGYQLNVNDRVLVKNQTDLSTNGIYSVQQRAWVRAKDWKVSQQVANGVIILDNNTGQLWRGVFAGVLNIGVTDVSFTDVTSSGRTITYVQETLPVGPVQDGAKWYKPSEATTYIYFVDEDGGQWVEDSVQSAEGTLRSELAATDSDVLVGGKEAGKVAKSTTLVTPAEWGILTDGSDETAKWQSLITFCATNRLGVGAFQGETLITSQLTLPSGFGGIHGDSQLHMVFKKGFNGELFSLNAQGLVLENFWIQGDGANFTGGGVYVVSDNIDIDHIRIEDTVDSPVICKANDSTFLNITNSHLAATDNVNTPAIRGDGVDISTGPTVRKFDKISGAQYLLDASGMNEYTLCNSLFSEITFDANSSKGKHFGNRITAASNDVTVLGADHVFSGNIISMGASNDFIINGTNNTFDESNRYSKGTNSKATPILDASYGGPITHSVTTKLTDVSSNLVLKGSTSDWVKGNSSVTAYYTLHDQKCYYTFQIIRGSSATNPVGTFSVTLPFKALVGSQGSVLIKSSTGTYYTGTLQVFGGGNSATLWINTATESINDSSIAFGTNATIQGTIDYLVAAS